MSTEIFSRDGSKEEDKPRTEDEPPASVNERATSSSRGERSTQQVAMARSSIQRLQTAVREKDDIIVALQDSTSAAYQAASREQAQLGALHEVFLANAGRGRSRSANLHRALQALARQGPDPSSSTSVTSTLTKAVARSMDDHLEQLASSHENEMQELNRSLESYKDRNQVLEAQLAEERMQHELRISNIVEEVRKQIPQDEQQQCSEIEKYQNQLRNKESKLKALRGEMRSMELYLMSSQQQKIFKKEKIGISPSEYAKVRTRMAYFQNQVSSLSEQLREAKLTSMEVHLADQANNEVVKQLQEESNKTKKITHRLAVQLAQYRQKEKQSSTSELGTHSLLYENKHGLLDDSNVTPEEIIQTLPHIHASLDHGFGVKGYKPGSLEDNLSKKIQTLQAKLKKCRSDLKESEENHALCEKIMQDFKKETHQYRLNMIESRQKLLLGKRKGVTSSECVKIKKLLENLQEVENENKELRKVIMVDQETTIYKLKKEVINLKRLCFEMGKGDAECDIHQYELPPIEDNTIPDKENETIQLKFDRDQALWKLNQLERRMHILFGTTFQDRGKTKVNCEYIIPPTIAPHAFARRKLIIQEPNALSLMQEFTKKAPPVASSPHEKKLEGLVEGLLRIIEKKRTEVIELQETCSDSIKHMEHERQLQQQMDELKQNIQNNDKNCPSRLKHYKVIEELKEDVERLTQLNSNLLHALEEMENSYLELKEKLHEATKDKFSPQRRCSVNEDEQHDLSDMEVQAQEISRLEKEMGEKSQTISDLKSQLGARDDELDYLHGQLAIQEAIEDEQDEKITKEQMAKENTDVDKLSLEDLQMANVELSKVCDQYEELLERQAEQLGISFEPLRNN